ncbi:unnamed protein product [Ostreobium quekettii]|uniref:Aldehyde dehydrogenase domain-containing protein n=1 Tax=Ostreobium quekettii TaxID=121088 RepID=A0A8S1IWF2_9CHLO|nr:unnamed protein product [Ostreobium quekettii]|eukprot:evm.model.scf_40.9 EVM.evm.TU.scf_40.9   scf_40:70382-75344(-)
MRIAASPTCRLLSTGRRVPAVPARHGPRVVAPFATAVESPTARDVDPAQILRNVRPKLLIDGDFVDAASGKTFPVLDPRTEDVVAQVAEADAADVDRAVGAARRAFDSGPWRKMSGRQRGKVMARMADLLEQRAEEFARIETLDNGKPLAESRAFDVTAVVSHFRYFAGWADKISGKTLQTNGNMFAYTLHEAIGVAGQIIPWNYPLLMLAWKVAPALACGCTVVLKVAEQTPMSALLFGELALEAGLPPGVLNILPGYGPTAGAALASHPGVDKVSFTGSTEVGREVMRAAAGGIKHVSLELGGKSAAIICPDVDLESVVDDTHMALFYNHGQNCCAGSRTYVHESLYDEFVERAVERAQRATVGDPFGDAQIGPLVDSAQFEKVLGYMKAGKAQGAVLRCGGGRAGPKGYYVEPTVFSDVRDEMSIAQEEIFGPVQSIMKWSSVEEVLDRANANPYGLAAGVWTKDLDMANRLSRGLRAGTVWVNCYNYFDDAVPFGGYKMSGFGRDLSEYALNNYMEVKAVVTPLEDPAWI